jgi:hypothetical protein
MTKLKYEADTSEFGKKYDGIVKPTAKGKGKK